MERIGINITGENKWIVYFTSYCELCRQYKENVLEDSWEEHYYQLIKKRQDDTIGW